MTIIADPLLSASLIRERQEKGLDRWDEVWEGEYVIMTQPNDEHQDLVAGLTSVLYGLVQAKGLGKVRPGINISDRIVDWRENYRCPDVAVFLNGSPAENHDTFWFGGPDFAVEISSPGDRVRDKLDFYSAVETKELLIIDRDPWSLELFRESEGRMKSTGVCTVDGPRVSDSQAVPLSWALVRGDTRPYVQATHQKTREQWLL